MDKKILLGIGVIAILAIVFISASPSSEPTTEPADNTVVSDTSDDMLDMSDDEMEDEDEPSLLEIPEAKAEVIAQSDVFTYEAFSDERYEELLGSESFAVFFHSKTCGTCAKKNTQIIDEVDDFSGGTILKIEFSESDTELRKELGVTNYDTFVIFDADGNATTTPGASIDDVRDAIE